MAKNKKRMKRSPIVYDLSHWMYGVKIETIKKDIEALERLGAEEIDIDPYEHYGSIYTDINAYHTREETDEEYKQRLESEAKAEKENEKRELEMLAKLKEKYKQ